MRRRRPLHLPLSLSAWRSTRSMAAPRALTASGPVAAPWRKRSCLTCSATSARTRPRSLTSPMCADTALLLRTRTVCASRCSANARVAAVMVRFRPLMSRRMATRTGRSRELRPWPLIQNLPLVRSGNLQLFSIFRDRPARQLEPLASQHAHDLGVAQRLLGVFLLDDLADALLDRHRG